MLLRYRFAVALACPILTTAAALAASSPTPAVLSAEDAFRADAFSRPQLAPDGRHFAALVGDERGLQGLLIAELPTLKPSGVRAEGSRSIAGFRWFDGDRLLFSTDTSWGLYTTTLADLKHHYPIGIYGTRSIVGLPRSRPDHVLVTGVDHGLAELNVNRRLRSLTEVVNGATVVRSFSPPHQGEPAIWFADRDGEVTLCSVWEDRAFHLYRYLRDRSTWEPVPVDCDRIEPMAVDVDPHYAWVVASSDTGYDLCRCELATGRLEPAVLHDPDYDPATGRLHFSTEPAAMVGITYVRRARTTRWFSSEYAAIQSAIDQRYPDTLNVFLHQDRTGRKFLFALTSPQRPDTVVLLDLDARTANPVASSAPWLEGRAFCPLQLAGVYTRDNVKLEGYLTLPVGASAEHPVPMVVLVHGGPWQRDTPEFDPEVQFLASRGYAVFQPAYRGSAGYSRAISHDPRFDFRLMHDDVTDATRAMIRNPVIDPQRVAIMGFGFGGYLALSGVAFEDNLYRCALSECGIFDWSRLLRSIRTDRISYYDLMVESLGKPGRDREKLEAISPLARVDRIHAPVLLGYGGDSGDQDVIQSKQLVAALKSRHVPCETVVLRFDGSRVHDQEDRIAYYHRVEAFLAAQLRGASPAGKN